MRSTWLALLCWAVLCLAVPTRALGEWTNKDNERVYAVVVQGMGTSEQQAREQAFAAAIDEALGTLVVSQIDIENNQVQRHRVLRYNSGYIHSFRVRDRTWLPDGQIVLDMEVWVKHISLAEGLVASGTVIDRSIMQQTAGILDSVNQESETGNKLLAAVVEDYPTRGLDVTVSNTALAVTANRRAAMTMDIAVKWNPAYLSGLAQALQQTSQLSPTHDCVHQNHQCRGSLDGTWGVTLWQPRDVIARPSGRVGFRDQERWRTVQRLAQPVMLRITVTDHRGQTMVKECRSLSDMGGTGLVNVYYSHSLHVNGLSTVRSRISLRSTFSSADLDTMSAVRVETVTAAAC